MDAAVDDRQGVQTATITTTRWRDRAWILVFIADAGFAAWGAMAAALPNLLGGPGGAPILTAGYEGFTKGSWTKLVAMSPMTADFIALLFRLYGIFCLLFGLMAIAAATDPMSQPWDIREYSPIADTNTTVNRLKFSMRTHFRATPHAGVVVGRACGSLVSAGLPSRRRCAPAARLRSSRYPRPHTAHTLHRQDAHLAALFVPPASPGYPLDRRQDCAVHQGFAVSCARSG
jgi:hypothetical protein